MVLTHIYIFRNTCTKIQDWWTVESKNGHCRVLLGKCSEGQNVSKTCDSVDLKAQSHCLKSAFFVGQKCKNK